MSILNSRPCQILLLVLLNGFTMSSLIIIWPERFILAMVFVNSMLVCLAILGILLQVQQLLAGNFGIKIIAIVFLLLQCCDFLDSLTAPKPRSRLYSSSPWYVAWIFITVLVTIIELRIMVGIWCDMCATEEEKKPTLPPSYSVCVIEEGNGDLPPPTYDEALKLKAASENQTRHLEIIIEEGGSAIASEPSNQIVLRCETLNERTNSRHSM